MRRLLAAALSAVAVAAQADNIGPQMPAITLAGVEADLSGTRHEQRSSHDRISVTWDVEAARDGAPRRELLDALGVHQEGMPPEVHSLAQRWWLGSGRADVGIGFGMIGAFGPAPGTPLAPGERPAFGGASLQPTFTLGWRYRLSDRTRVFADTTGLRSALKTQPDALYDTRLGVEWKPARSGALGFDKGSLRMQFSSGYQMAVKVRKGGLGVQLRSQF